MAVSMAFVTTYGAYVRVFGFLWILQGFRCLGWFSRASITL